MNHRNCIYSAQGTHFNLLNQHISTQNRLYTSYTLDGSHPHTCSVWPEAKSLAIEF